MRAKTVNESINNRPDLTRTPGGEKSVGAKLEPIISNIGEYVNDPQGLKDAFFEILDDENTHVSEMKKREYINAISRMHDFRRISQYLTNIYFKSANMGLR
ncbi:MAG: hypothetical protein ACOC1K_03395 [Nanoarchaeota archaeon]